MEDPYKEVFEEIGNAFRKQSEIILELAQMCLTVKQYQEFAKRFEKKGQREEKTTGSVMTGRGEQNA